MFPLFTCFSFAKKKKGDVTLGQRLHHARGVGNKVVLCRSAILCVLFLCYNTSEGTWRCLHWLLKANHVVPNYGELCDAWFGLLKIDVAMAQSIVFLRRSKHMQRKAYAFHGRPTLKDVERQLRNGSFRELNEMKMYSNVTEMDATIESDTSQNNQRVLYGELL